MPADSADALRAAQSLPASTRTNAPARVALALGMAGALGEEILALLIASSDYRQVLVGVTQPMGSATARFSPWVVGQGYPVVDEAWLCVTGDETFVPSASPIHRVSESSLLEAAQTALACGAQRLVVVAPLAALMQMSAAPQSTVSSAEIELVKLPVEQLVIVRPTAADVEDRGASLPRRLVRSAARAVADIMLPQYARALSAPSAARAIVAAVARAPRGVTVIGARELLKVIETRFPQLKPTPKGVVAPRR